MAKTKFDMNKTHMIAIVSRCISFGSNSIASASAHGKIGPYIRPTIDAENAFSNMLSTNHIRRCMARATAEEDQIGKTIRHCRMFEIKFGIRHL